MHGDTACMSGKVHRDDLLNKQYKIKFSRHNILKLEIYTNRSRGGIKKNIIIEAHHNLPLLASI